MSSELERVSLKIGYSSADCLPMSDAVARRAPVLEPPAVSSHRLLASHRLLRLQGVGFADLFYETLWRDHPVSQSIFRQTELAEQRRSLMAGLVVICGGLSKPCGLEQELANMGIRHRSYGVLSQHYDWVADAWRKALEASLGDDLDAPTQRGWERVIHHVTTAMQSGATGLDLASVDSRPKGTTGTGA